MATDSIAISNIALKKVGDRAITALSDSTEQARAVNAVYDEILKEVLSEHPWSFAQKRAELVDITDPATSGDSPSAWQTTTAYAVATQVSQTAAYYTCIVAHTSGTFATDLAAGDWVVCEEIIMTEDGMKHVYYKPSDFVALNFVSVKTATYRIEEQGILSDTPDLKIIYTYNNTTTTTYPSPFTIALATRLAAEICFDLTNDAKKARDLLEDYELVKLPKAMSFDSQQGTPLGMIQDEWEDARKQGSSSIGIRSWDGWFPTS